MVEVDRVVDAGRPQGVALQISSEALPGRGVGGAQPGVVRLRAGDDVLDVGLARGVERLARVGAEDPAESRDDVVLDALRVGVVATVVRRAPVLVSDGEAPPCPGPPLGGLAQLGEVDSLDGGDARGEGPIVAM